MAKQNDIVLSDLIEALRDDLFESAKFKPKGWQPLFEVEEAIVEAHVKVTKQKGASAGLSFKVLSVGASVGASTEATHKVTLKLKPTKRTVDLERRVDPLLRGLSEDEPRKRRSRTK